MFGAFAEFERAMMLERQRPGIEKAKAEGKSPATYPLRRRSEVPQTFPERSTKRRSESLFLHFCLVGVSVWSAVCVCCLRVSIWSRFRFDGVREGVISHALRLTIRLFMSAAERLLLF